VFKEHLLDDTATITVVSDGGLKDNVGSYGWAMAKETKRVIAVGQGVAHGEPKSSHRSECFGKLAWLVFLRNFAEYHRIRIQCTIESFCDNKAVIKQTRVGNKWDRTSDVMIANYDLIKEIIAQQEMVMEMTESYIEGVHVKGHQDAKKTIRQLTIQEWLNVKADKLATEAMQYEECKPAFHTPSCKAYLINGGVIQGSKERHTTLWKWSEFQLQDYYMTKLKLNQKQLHGIDWRAVKIARNKMDQQTRSFAIKYGIGWLATGSRLEQQGHNVTACAYCNGKEDNEHIFQCNNRRAEILGKIEEFDTYMESLDTNTDIRKAIVIGIKKWVDPNIEENIPEKTTERYRHQNMIGWKFFLRGFMSIKWAEQQETHYRGKEDKRSGESWGAKITLWWITEAKAIWQERNNATHEKTNRSERRDEEEALEQARQLYEREMDMSEQDREVLNMSLDKRLKQNWKTVSEWVANIRPMVKRGIQNMQQKLRRQQPDIRNFTNSASQTETTDNGLSQENQGNIALNKTSGTTHLV
jgi:hypothetical protein